MDFLDSLDLHTTNEKSNRVRSWYLYEQYKSLEKSQLDAARKLKHRSYQDRILHRELSERRARRQLGEPFDIRRSESHIRSDPTKTPYTGSTDSILESFYEQDDVVHDEEHDNFSQHSETSILYEEYKSSEDRVNSCSDSINSVLENTNLNENMAEDIKDDLEIVKQNIAEIINMQIDTENDCLEKYTELCDKKCDESLKSKEKCDKSSVDCDKYCPKYDNGLFTMWTKLVAFSYNVMQMNRGNCYYDYSSQFLTGVLAFDVLRRGINRMCYILQPYVSPIKFASDEYETAPKDVNLNQQCARYKNTNNIENYKCCPFRTLHYDRKKYRALERKYQSEDKWHSRCKYSYQNRLNEFRIRGTSEPLRSVARFSGGRNSFKDKLSCNNSQRTQTDKHPSCKCPQLKKAINPILKLSRYIDMILQEIEE